MKYLLCLLLSINAFSCSTYSVSKNNATVSCFNNGKLVLRMKAKGGVWRYKEPLFKFKDDRGFDVEVDQSCVIVYTNEKLYERPKQP